MSSPAYIAATNTKILIAAKRLSSDSGVYFTLSDVAKESDCSIQTVRNRFGDKSQLLRELASETIYDIENSIDSMSLEIRSRRPCLEYLLDVMFSEGGRFLAEVIVYLISIKGIEDDLYVRFVNIVEDILSDNLDLEKGLSHRNRAEFLSDSLLLGVKRGKKGDFYRNVALYYMNE